MPIIEPNGPASDALVLASLPVRHRRRQASRIKYANVSMSASDSQLVADARSHWQNTVGGLQDVMREQATVVGNIDTNRQQMSALVGASQSATGALQAQQLAPLPDDKPVKVTLDLPAGLHRSLIAYAEILGREAEQPPVCPIVPMPGALHRHRSRLRQGTARNSPPDSPIG